MLESRSGCAVLHNANGPHRVDIWQRLQAPHFLQRQSPSFLVRQGGAADAMFRTKAYPFLFVDNLDRITGLCVSINEAAAAKEVMSSLQPLRPDLQDLYRNGRGIAQTDIDANTQTKHDLHALQDQIKPMPFENENAIAHCRFHL
jgi:hypothetical protein